ncbi:hypothetical protein NQZ68_040751 [Dissostichus eleginoides]|nr:hypothetical protein NQZ68_040751 [Dissostichus eleginoides]
MELASALERGTQSEAHCKGQRYLEAKGRTLAPESLSRSKEATTHVSMSWMGQRKGTLATTKATAWRFLPLSRPTQPIDHF